MCKMIALISFRLPLLKAFSPHQNNMNEYFKIVITFLLQEYSTIVFAQDHYWSQQYGGQATLMGGTVVAGSNDHSNIYYNPGAIGFIDSARVTASTYVFGFEYMRLKNAAGTGLDLKSIQLNILPQLIAGSIGLKKVPKLKLIYGTLMRSRTNVGFEQNNENSYEVIAGSPGAEYYKASVEYKNNSVEQWAGFGLAYQINPTWSVGISTFAAYTHIESRSTESNHVDAVANGVPYIATVNEYNSMNLNQFTHIFKLGVAARFKHVHLGMALTLPGIRVWGKGKIEKSFEVYNLNQNAADTTMPAQQQPSYVISDVQTGLNSYYKIPLSAAVGLKLVYPEFTLSASLEYFMGYKNHIVMQGADRAVIRPAALYGNDTIQDFMKLQTTAAFVLNAGIGAEFKIRRDVNLLLGVRTDLSNRTDYLSNNSVIKVVSAKSPLWHYLYISSGFTYKLSFHHLTMGFDYGIGIPIEKQQIFNLTEPAQATYLRGDLNKDVNISVHKLNFILSYTYFFRPREKNFGPLSIIDEIKKERRKSKRKKQLQKAQNK